MNINNKFKGCTILKILKVIFCEDVTELPNSQTPIQKKMAIVNPTGSFVLEYLPSTFSFSALVMFQGVPEGPKNLTFKFSNPRTSKVLFEASFVITAEAIVNQVIPSEFAGVNINIQLKNILIEDEGEYTLNIQSDGSDIHTEVLHFFKIKN